MALLVLNVVRQWLKTYLKYPNAQINVSITGIAGPKEEQNQSL